MEEWRSADEKESAMARQAETRGRSAWIGLAVILIVYCALASVHSFATRLQWGPDEPAHIIYVRSIGMDGRIPELTHGEQDNRYSPGGARTHEAHQPPLYYVLAGARWRIFSGRAEEVVSYRDDAAGASHAFSVPGPVRPVRFLSVACGAVTLLLLWATARTVFPARPELWLAGTALSAFTPMFTYLNSVINNDALLAAVFAAIAWQWTRVIRFGATGRDVVVLGALLGLAMNVKETALGFVALSVVVMAFEPGAKSRGQRVGRMAAVAGLAAALGGWWMVRKWAIFGTPFVYPFVYPLLSLPAEQKALRMVALPGQIFMFTFVPLDVIWHQANMALLSRFFGGLALLSAVGLLVLFVRRKRLGLPRYEVLALVLWLAAGAVVVAGLLRNVFLVDWHMGSSGGRYLVCVLPLLGLASARGVAGLLGEGQGAGRALAVICLRMRAGDAYVIWATAAAYGTLGR